jgi:hypothetical protein
MGKLTMMLLGLLRCASLLACLLVVVSFVMFALDQAGASSTISANEAAGHSATYSAPSAQTGKQTALRRDIDKVSAKITSPFKSFTDWGSQWAVRIVQMLIALALYGFGIGYLFRYVRVRADNAYGSSSSSFS